MNLKYSTQFLQERRRPLPWMIGVGLLLMVGDLFVSQTEQWLFDPTSIGAGVLGAGIASWIQYFYYQRKPYLSIEKGTLKKYGWPSRKVALSQIEHIAQSPRTMMLHLKAKKLKIDLTRLENQDRKKLKEALKSYA